MLGVAYVGESGHEQEVVIKGRLGWSAEVPVVLPLRPPRRASVGGAPSSVLTLVQTLVILAVRAVVRPPQGRKVQSPTPPQAEGPEQAEPVLEEKLQRFATVIK